MWTERGAREIREKREETNAASVGSSLGHARIGGDASAVQCESTYTKNGVDLQSVPRYHGYRSMLFYLGNNLLTPER